MRDDLPKGHVALLLTDIEGSTRLLHRLGAEGYGRAQAEHRQQLRAAFRQHDGVEVDTQGDAFFYAFPSTAQCLRGAVAGTRALARHTWFHGDPVKVRMGMHCGEPQPTDEGYVGMVVNTAARVAAIGHGGQILLSADAATEIDVASADLDVTLRDLGSHRLKDLDEQQHLYQVVIPELPSDFPPPRSAELRPNNLPVPLTPFIGRAQLVSQVRDLVLNPSTRAVTLLGPGGTGKSRLALRVADELLHALEDGAFFVGLASIRDPALVLPSVASALGLKEEPGRPLLETLKEHLAPKQLLLLLDNFEQVHKAARDVAAMLAACPGLKVITTSRQPLRITGERGVPVPPMALPNRDEPLPPLPVVSEFEAVRLFVESAIGARWDFELTEDNAADVVEICRRVDGLPLAIELATAKLYAMPVSKLLASLDHRLQVLTDGAVDLLDHQQTLRDLVAWSYDLLEPGERQLWRRLAVFTGGGTLEAVQSVCNAGGKFQIPRDVDDLAAKSLVNLEFDPTAQVEGDAGDHSARRVTMLETLREFAVECLMQEAEAGDILTRHSTFFRALAEHAAPCLRGPEVDVWLARLDKDLLNFRAAMEYGFAGQTRADHAVGIAGALWFYFYERGLFSEGRRWLEQAVTADAELAATAPALLGLANLERIQGTPDMARSHCEAALTAYRTLNDEGGSADALSQLGAIFQHLGDMAEAEACLTEAAELQHRTGARGRLSFTLVLVGALKQLRGDLAGAQQDYAQSLVLGRELGDRNYIATALVNLGEIQLLQDQRQDAAAHLHESMAIYQELGVRNAVAYCLELLGGIAAADADCHKAAVLFGCADRLRELLDAPVESFNRERYDRDIQMARQGAGESEFAAAFERGRNLALEEAVRLARVDQAATA